MTRKKSNQESPEHLAKVRIEMANSNNATELDLDNLELVGLPPEIGKLTSLRKLSLSGNKLNSLPPEMSNLSNLTSLFLSRNNFTRIPDEALITNLTHLSLAENKIQKVLFRNCKSKV